MSTKNPNPETSDGQAGDLSSDIIETIEASPSQFAPTIGEVIARTGGAADGEPRLSDIGDEIERPVQKGDVVETDGRLYVAEADR
jgi:hypothetical protein